VIYQSLSIFLLLIALGMTGYASGKAAPQTDAIYFGGDSVLQIHPTPEFNPFENLTPEQETCFKQAWGDEVYHEIVSFVRPPTHEEEKVMPECLGEAFMPPGEHEPDFNIHNPFSDQVFYAFSQDGLTWSGDTLLAEKASVPDVIRTSDGTLWVYWVDFSFMDGPDMEQIGVALSQDNGQTWERLENIVFSGLGKIVPVDPDVIELPDGRLRMYFYDITVRQLSHPIYSAISEDGFHFTLEAGERLWMDNIYDPDVIRLADGSYRMYLNGEDIFSATSPDGLTFTLEEGVRIERGNVPGSILMPDGSIRLYSCIKGISVHESPDGLNFSPLKTAIIQPQTSKGQILCDPAITAVEEGYLIVYKTNSGE
jgi:hypothetical protein